MRRVVVGGFVDVVVEVVVEVVVVVVVVVEVVVVAVVVVVVVEVVNLERSSTVNFASSVISSLNLQ